MRKVVRKQRFYPVRIAELWHAITDPEALCRWFMQADFKAEVGYHFQFQDQPRGKWDGVLTGKVLAVDEPHHLAYTWKGEQMKHVTTVRWHLSASDGGTLVKLEHAGFEGINDIVIGFFHQFGWNKYFRQLSGHLNGYVDGQ